jgi:nucleotide-binding universal stress UspA family protein
MKLLVVTMAPISGDELRAALPDAVDPSDAEVMVVAPALQPSPLKFWLSDADEAIARAREVGAQSREQLSEAGVDASADTGEADPIEAIQDALITFPADRIVLFTHDESERAYREDVDPAEVQERFGLPVDRATVSA